MFYREHQATTHKKTEIHFQKKHVYIESHGDIPFEPSKQISPTLIDLFSLEGLVSHFRRCNIL